MFSLVEILNDELVSSPHQPSISQFHYSESVESTFSYSKSAESTFAYVLLVTWNPLSLGAQIPSELKT